MSNKNSLHIASLAFLCSYGDGTSADEVDSEIMKAAWQLPGTVHYDRSHGGGFKEIEQDTNNVGTILKFASNLIQSVVQVNEAKGNDPYILIGYNNIRMVNKDEGEGDYVVEISYSLMQDLEKSNRILM